MARAVPARPDETGIPALNQDSLRYALICGCFTLSGLAALIYQTAWTRQFALVFGTSELAVATVLAAYMGGLALGARGIEWLLPKVQRPIRLYAALELAIAMAALVLVPACLWLAERVMVAALGGLPEPPGSGAAGNTLFYLLAAMLTLLVPTTLMGATLPLLARDGVHSDAQVGPRIGMLYACNTAGAVLGALLGALALLPAIGLRATTWFAAAVNIVVFALAMFLLRFGGEVSPVVGTEPQRARFRQFTLPGAAWILPLVLASGAVSFFHEVLWTRLLQRVIGSSIQAFGVMVASFLLGIAIGGAIGARLATDRDRSVRWFIVSQVAVALAAVAAWYALLHWGGVPKSPSTRVLFGLLILLPLSLAIGVSYPLAVRVLARDALDAAAASARVYSWNTAGAILGALVGGFVLIPALRYEGAVHLAVIASLVLAVAAGGLLIRPGWRLALPALVFIAAVGLLFQPAAPERLLLVSPLRSDQGTLVHYSVGRSADVVVVREDGLLDLRSNGLPEAGSPVLGAAPTANVEAWMSIMAVLARPDARDMLIVGFGGGNVAQAVPPSVRRVDVIELEPRVIEANRAIASQRQRDPLQDARLNVIINDARGALALTTRRYDAIVSQPSHPWTAGASHLYTREFMQQARQHLKEAGVFVQWMGAEFTDEALLRSLVGTLATVFREVRVYRPSSTTLLFMGSDAPIDPERRPQSMRATLDRSPLHYARFGINTPEDLVVALALDDAGARRFVADQQPITDDDNRLATANVYERRLGMNGEQVATLLAPFDPLALADSFIYREIAPQLSFEYMWRRAVLWAGGDKATLERMRRLADLLGDTDQSQLLRYMMAMHLKQPDIARQLLAEGLMRWPDSVMLQYAAAEGRLSGLSRAAPTAVPVAVDERLPAEPALVVRLTRAATEQRWGEVADGDAQLARVPWTAQWGLQAAQLRAEWRMRVKNPDLRQRFGEEGIAIADRAIVTQPDVFWHSLRAWSATGTNRPEVMLESIAAFCITADQIKEKLAGGERRLARDRAVALTSLVQQLERDARVDAARVGDVKRRLDEVVDALR
jgi:spermidine synthase